MVWFEIELRWLVPMVEISGISVTVGIYGSENFEYVIFSGKGFANKLFAYKLQYNRRDIVVSNENIEDTLTKTLLENLQI